MCIFASASESESWSCELNLPNSFAGDGIRLQTEGCGSTQHEADEHACRRAVAHFLMMEHSKLLLEPNHWKITIDQLKEELRSLCQYPFEPLEAAVGGCRPMMR